MTPEFATDLISRRRVIAAGLCTIGCAGITACTNYGAPAAPPSDVPESGAAASASAGLTVNTAAIPVGGGAIFADTDTVITQPSEGEFKAFSATCTHAGCTVAAVTTTISCDCHGSQFSITDGSVVKSPAGRPLAAKTATVQGDSVIVTG